MEIFTMYSHKIFFFTILIFGLLLSGCASSHKVVRKLPESIKINFCTLHVDGVECQLCARTVCNIVSSTPGASHAKYHTTDKTYADSYLTFVLDPVHTIDLDTLKMKLEKEGFSFVSLDTQERDMKIMSLS